MDVTRIPVYIYNNKGLLADNVLLLFITTASALAGTFAGGKFLKKISLKTFKTYVAATIIIIGILLALGII